MWNSVSGPPPRSQDSPLRFASKASLIGGLLGVWEAAFTIWRDAEVTVSRPGALALVGVAFGCAAAVVFVIAFAWAAGRRSRPGAFLLGSKTHPATLALLTGGLIFGVFHLNEAVLPGKTHPLSLLCDGALIGAAWAGARFLPSFRIPRGAALGICSAAVVAAVVLALFAARPAERLAPPAAPPPATPNLVLITMDTTRADRIGALGGPSGLTPNLDRLATRGAAYRHAYCPMPLTGPSHAAILTGVLPRQTGITRNGVRLDDRFTTLAETLRNRGYRTAAVVGAFPVSSKLGYAQGFEYFDDNFSPFAAMTHLMLVRILGATGLVRTKAELHRPADRVTAAAVKWLKTEKRSAFFLWVHYFDPHTPYAPPGSFRIVSKSADPQTRLYEGEIAFMDQQLGVLLAALDQTGATGNTIIVAVADHGESLREHGYFYDHGRDVYEPCMRIPLIIAGPAASGPIDEPPGAVIDQPVTTADLYAYLAARLQPSTSSQPRPYIPHGPVYGESWEEGIHMTMAVARPDPQGPLYKYVWKEPAGPEALYDLDATPYETRDLGSLVPEIRDALRRQTQTYYNRQPRLGFSADMDAETKKNLRSLGYL